jgi:hypothetical protein
LTAREKARSLFFAIFPGLHIFVVIFIIGKPPSKGGSHNITGEREVKEILRGRGEGSG